MDKDSLRDLQYKPNDEVTNTDATSHHKGKGRIIDTNDGDVESCTICLQPISERAVAVPCNHLSFDFICLAAWLHEQPKCPLCKASVTEVQYDWHGPEDYQTYRVPVITDEAPKSIRADHDRSSHRGTLPGVLARRRRAHPSTTSAPPPPRPLVPDPHLDRRRAVYRDRRYSLRVGANRFSRYRDFTSRDVAASRTLQSRARTFLRRELQVFPFLDEDNGDDARPPLHHHRRRGNRDFLIEYIVALLRVHEVKGADGAIETVVAEILGRDRARLLLHELEAWLRSPFETLAAWDMHVQYAEAGSSREAAKSGELGGAREV